MKRYPVELSILALTLLLGLIGCLWLHHYTAAGLVSEEEPLLFGATYMTMNNPFYEVIDEELRNQVEAGGDVMITMDPQLSIERQIEQIKTMMAEGIDVLIVESCRFPRLGRCAQGSQSEGHHRHRYRYQCL